jgi:integrase
VIKRQHNRAVEWGKIEFNPILKVKKFREPDGRERILTAEEMRCLIDAAPAHLKPVLVIALNTGMRRNEILSLKWANINPGQRFIFIGDSKSGKSRKVPMNGMVIEAFKQIPRNSEYVFFNPETKGPIKDVKTAFKSACGKAKINGLRLHDLRHTAASRMVEAGIDLVTVSKILGHSSIQMTMRYAHPTPENMQRAVDSLEKCFNPGENPVNEPRTVEVRVPVTPSILYH